LRNVRTGASARRFVAGDPYAYPVFFPNGSLLAAGPEPHTLAIYANPSLRPLALLGERVRDFVQLAVSPDGSHIAVRQLGSILFYRETGPDCPESPLGALGFPHLWLFIALATAAAFSLRYDALRSSSNPTVRIARIALILFLIALPRTLHFLAASCIGENLLTPAPILLLAAIGLATGVRFWRLATLITLAIALPVELYSLHLLHNAGLSQRTPTLLFDRTYSIPNSLAFGLLAMITILIPLALYLLTRRER
jgi:hypothetical protein